MLIEIDYASMNHLLPHTRADARLFSGDAYEENEKIKNLTRLLNMLLHNTPFADIVYVGYRRVISLIRTTHMLNNRVTLAKSTKPRALLVPNVPMTLKQAKSEGYTANDYVGGLIYSCRNILYELGYSSKNLIITFAKQDYVDEIMRFVSKRYHTGGHQYYYVSVWYHDRKH